MVYLNGDFVPMEQARVPVMDRGFLFGDGAYEVIPVYGRCLLRLAEHLDRLRRTLDGIGIDPPLSHAQWGRVLDRLVAQCPAADQAVYLHVTRGTMARRDHAWPADLEPTVLAMTNPLAAPDAQLLAHGVGAIVLDDDRWLHCDLKTTALLANALLRQRAVQAGCKEALLVRDGLVTEGAASNVLAVVDAVLVTPPKGPRLLPGITRDVVLELARAHGVEAAERDLRLDELRQAQEVWITSSTQEILPVTRLDDRAVGGGRPGPVWQRLHALFQNHKRALAAA